jgi:hypothetical protein
VKSCVIRAVIRSPQSGGKERHLAVEAATDREIFLAYLDNVLCPKLQPGDVVVMDNLSSHKVTGVRERIDAVGARPSLERQRGGQRNLLQFARRNPSRHVRNILNRRAEQAFER